MKKGIPLIFFHLGDSYYLQYTFNQILKSNPDSDIYLIGDDRNKHYESIGIKHVDATSCEKTAKGFEKIYVHLSSMAGFVERICFQRWMYMRDFVLNQNITGKFCCLDSDVLVYGDITEYCEKYCPDADVTLHGKYGPGCNVFQNVDVLTKLVDNTFRYYNSPELVQELSDIYHKQHRNVTDMEMISRFVDDCNIKGFDLLQIIDGCTFDSHIAKITDSRLIRDKALKKVVIKDGAAYCLQNPDGTPIKMMLLHMQGFYKVFTYQYYTGDAKKVSSKIKAYLIKEKHLRKRDLSRMKNSFFSNFRILWYEFKSCAVLILKRLKIFKNSDRKKYSGRKLLSEKGGNQFIKDSLASNKVICCARFGCNELATTVDSIKVKNGMKKHIRNQCRVSVCRNAGFFPNDEAIITEFGIRQANLASNVDFFATWFWKMEDYVIKAYGNEQAKVGFSRALEPYYFDDPWSKELKGKKVLVIHPFEKTIRQQYEKRELLFSNPDVLPEFTLLTLKAVQSSAFTETEYDTWFDALQYMFDEAMKMDFDVAILGCGAYGFSLACMLKQAGKTAIHMGGATQILFGIKGKRWDNHPVISKLYNEHWVRPSEEETPKQANEVEGACYW